MVKICFIVTCVVSSLFPCFLSEGMGHSTSDLSFDWPDYFEGNKLSLLELTEREIKFANKFPGEIRRFTDGHREVLVRWITSPNRKVHPSSDCFKGFGFTTIPQKLYRDTSENLWGAFIATKQDQSLYVREIIYDQTGQSWADVSSWYWAAAFGQTQGPWCAMTVAENDKID